MAIVTDYESMKLKFNPKYWDSIEDFEAFYLKDLSERISEPNYYTDKNGVQQVIPQVNHHPIPKKYEIWQEGYSVTGGSGSAILIGTAFARNFAQACHILMCKKYLKQVKKYNNPQNNEYFNPSRWDYDPKRLTVWGCRLYWSEELARKSFG